MQKYLTMTDFSGSGIMPILKAVVTAIPPFFPITLFFIFILGTATSYFAMLKLTGKKRFFQAITAMSFISFLSSIILVAMNDGTITFLSGYWVGFYIVVTVGAYILLEAYK